MGSYAAAADLYTLLYSTLRDFDAEAGTVAHLIRDAVPDARHVLDVGCGPGEHAAGLARRGFEVDGVDAEPRFVELARQRVPGGRFDVGDMTSLQGGSGYDAVICLFGTVAYARTPDALARTASSLAGIAREGGVVLVEPWLEPADVRDGFLLTLTAREPGLEVCRMSRTRVEGRLCRLEFEYLVGRSSGIERLSEHHELGLFTRTETEAALDGAGLVVRRDPEGVTGRGLYVCRKPPWP